MQKLYGTNYLQHLQQCKQLIKNPVLVDDTQHIQLEKQIATFQFGEKWVGSMWWTLYWNWKIAILHFNTQNLTHIDFHDRPNTTLKKKFSNN